MYFCPFVISEFCPFFDFCIFTVQLSWCAKYKKKSIFRLSSGDKVYLNLRNHVQAWRTPSDYKLRSYFLTAEEIAQILHDVNSEMNGRHKFESNVVKLQARIRGFLVRQRLFSMLQHYYENERKIGNVQLWFTSWQFCPLDGVLIITPKKANFT